MGRLNRVDLPEPVKDILQRLKSAGFKALIAGGAVRDHLLGKACSDMDILTNAGLEDIGPLFPDLKTAISGRSFPVCRVNGVEIATARHAREPDNFPASDLAARDLTINAMAWDPDTGMITDLFGGREDISDRTIRFTGDPVERIREDPVRMIRACRFQAMLKARMDPASQAAVSSFAPMVAEKAAPERIQVELFKAMGLDRPSEFFIHLHTFGLLAYVLPSLARCHDLDGGPYHGETVFEHCMLVGDGLWPKQPLLRLAGFLHDTGKADAAHIKDNRLSFRGHEKQTQALEKDLENLRFSRKDAGYILALTRSHMRPLTEETTPRAARRLLAALQSQGLDIHDFLRMRIADRKGNLKKPPYTLKEIRIRLETLLAPVKAEAALGINQLCLSGSRIQEILGIGPGPRVGQVKKMLFEKVLDTPSLNTPDQLEALCRSLKTRSLP